jgi:hypothetical protein
MSATTFAPTTTAPPVTGRRGSLVSVAGALTRAPLLLVLAIALAINLPTLHDYFHGDDYLAFVDMVSKPFVKHMTEVVVFDDNDVYWRPLGELYYYVIWSVFGLNEVAFHAANISVFLLTLVLLYAFCLQAGLGRYVATGACAFLTLFPNHVVSVSWVTNGPRLVAVMLALASLVLLQRAIATRRLRFEMLSLLAFFLSGLADETALALAPVLVAYSFWFDTGAGSAKRALLRLVPLAVIAGLLVPLQFIMTDKDPSFGVIGIGWHMPQHFWALSSKLVLPSRDGISFSQMESVQWVAGGAAIAALAAGALLGSTRLRFMCLWTALSILPFTIWVTPLAPARYVYMAAVPFAVVVSWAAVSLFEWLRNSSAGLRLSGSLTASALLGAFVLVAVVFLGSVGASITRERDRTFARDTEPYRILADDLKAAAPTVPKGSRIVIYYGIWNSFFIWPDAVAKTIYRDPTLHVVNVPRAQVESGGPARDPKDIVLFYTGKGFIRAAPPKSATTASQP